MTTTQLALSEALQEVALRCDLVWELEIWGDKVWGIRGFTDFKQGTENQNQWGIFGAICEECERRHWDWHADSEDDGYVFVVITNLTVEDDGELNATRFTAYSLDVNASPAHAAVLAFLKAIKGETTE